MKLALVTGGHRRIGGAIAARLEAGGWTVARHSHHAADDGEGFAADLSDANSVERLMPAIAARFGRAPDLLVNSASRFDDDDAASVTPASLAAHHMVNAAAPQILALELARAGGEGSVVNILDQRVRNPNRDQLSYTLSKAALAAATRTLAVALAPRIRVNAVAPGLTLPAPGMDAGAMDRIAAMMPLARLPEPADIAEAVAYFASARAVTGQTLFVDGGASLTAFERDFSFL